MWAGTGSAAGAVLCLLLALATAMPCPAAASATASELFPRPSALEPYVDFWTRIYAELDTASGLIHDSHEPRIGYRVLYLNPGAPLAAQDAAIGKAVEDYRLALTALAAGQRDALDAVERQALAVWGERASAEVLSEAATRVRFQRGQSDRFQQGLERAARWQRAVAAIFRERDLPVELAALPHVESSYNPRALSKAGAAGLWQLMPVTARRYLRVDDEVDERFDVLESTAAAANLLQHNYSVLANWPLAITAYNHGLAGVRRAVRETGSTDIAEIIARYRGERFGFASRNFYAAFLAACDIATAPRAYFADPTAVAAVTTVHLPVFLPAWIVADVLGTRIAVLRALNPSVHHAVWNGAELLRAGTELRVPAPPGDAQRRIDGVVATHGFDGQLPRAYHEVRLGESLSGIALDVGGRVEDLVALNGLDDAHQVQAGQVLRVPMGAIPRPLGSAAAALLPALLAANARDRRPTRTVTLDRTDALPVADPAATSAPCAGDVEASTRSSPSAAEFEAAIAAAPAETQPDLAADPIDYSVRADGSIEIQIAETLGHYAQWLDLTSDRIEAGNQRAKGDPLIVGQRLRLDFARATPARFEQQRVNFHRNRQMEYFRRYRITGIREHRIEDGHSLWTIAVDRNQIPLWLLRQYNPDIAIDTVLPLGSIVVVPVVEKRSASDCARNAADGTAPADQTITPGEKL